MSTQFYTKHFQQKTAAVAKPGGSYKARRLVLFFVTIKSTYMNIKNLFLLFFEGRCSTLVGSLITVTLSENKHIVGQRPRTHKTIWTKTHAPITHAAFELTSGHLAGQFKTNSQKQQRQPLNSCLITSRDNLWENSKTHANNILISFLATSKSNLGTT
jgi:hypothetical protein